MKNRCFHHPMTKLKSVSSEFLNPITRIRATQIHPASWELHTYTYICTYVDTYIHTYIYIHVLRHTYTCICTYIIYFVVLVAVKAYIARVFTRIVSCFLLASEKQQHKKNMAFNNMLYQ